MGGLVILLIFRIFVHLISGVMKKTDVKVKEKVHVSRPQVHAKSKTSNLKTSKNYVKKYKGQGK